MKDHIPTLALVTSLAMVLIALVILTLNGRPDGPVVIGLVGAVGTVVGVIGGFSQNTAKGASQVTNATTANISNDQTTTEAK